MLSREETQKLVVTPCCSLLSQSLSPYLLIGQAWMAMKETWQHSGLSYTGPCLAPHEARFHSLPQTNRMISWNRWKDRTNRSCLQKTWETKQQLTPLILKCFQAPLKLKWIRICDRSETISIYLKSHSFPYLCYKLALQKNIPNACGWQCFDISFVEIPQRVNVSQKETPSIKHEKEISIKHRFCRYLCTIHASV